MSDARGDDPRPIGALIFFHRDKGQCLHRVKWSVMPNNHVTAHVSDIFAIARVQRLVALKICMKIFFRKLPSQIWSRITYFGVFNLVKVRSVVRWLAVKGIRASDGVGHLLVLAKRGWRMHITRRGGARACRLKVSSNIIVYFYITWFVFDFGMWFTGN